MEIKQKREYGIDVVEVSGLSFFDANKTFDCGQCFRFDKVRTSSHEAEYFGVAHGKCVSFASDNDKLYVYNSTIEDFQRIWRGFLALDVDYAAVNHDVLEHAHSSVMEQAMSFGSGIRILKQDAYEAVISFIISQNNNIPRIKKIIEALSQRCGTQIDVPDGMISHLSDVSSLCAFPTCSALAELGEQGLFELKTGFRAKYIYDAVERILDGRLSLSDVEGAQTTDECIARLCEVKGIGVKVASCAALFGMARYDAFPIDVWMKRVAQKYFSEDAEEFSSARFGKYAGIAQQYLFYYERYLGGASE